MTDEGVTKEKTEVSTPADLATAREARGMSQVDISQRIKLQVRQVNALEEGQWDALPGKSFVRGALRSYGKLLDVDVAPLLESIGGFAEPSQVSGMRPLDASLSRSSGMGFNGGGRGSPILWVIAGLIGVVALVLYFGSDGESSRIRSWLPSGGAPAGSSSEPAPAPATPSSPSSPSSGISSSPDPTATIDAASSPTPSFGPRAADPAAGSSAGMGAAGTGTSAGTGSSAAPSAPTAVSFPSATAPAGAANTSGPSRGTGSMPAPATSAPGNAATANPGAAAGGVGTAPAASAAPGAPGAPAAAAPVMAAAASTQTLPASPASTTTNPQSSTPRASAGTGGLDPAAAGTMAPTAAGSTKGLMRFKAAEDAWVEVRQADGSALHNGLIKAGSSIELTGKPPYRLTLGNANRLELVYEGKVQDLAAHTRANNIARLQLK